MAQDDSNNPFNSQYDQPSESIINPWDEERDILVKFVINHNINEICQLIESFDGKNPEIFPHIIKEVSEKITDVKENVTRTIKIKQCNIDEIDSKKIDSFYKIFNLMLSINGFINDYKNIYRFTFNENLLYLFVEI